MCACLTFEYFEPILAATKVKYGLDTVKCSLKREIWGRFLKNNTITCINGRVLGIVHYTPLSGCSYHSDGNGEK